MRVNARFEGIAEQQIAYLANTTGLKVSEVLRESVAIYYQQVRGGEKRLKHLSKLIGEGDSGHSDVASNVKKYLVKGLEEKHRQKNL
jgi:hypothetical protein